MKKLLLRSIVLVAFATSSLNVFAQPNFEWASVAGGTGTDLAYSLAVDASGNMYSTGYFQSTVDFDPGAGISNVTSAGAIDIYIQKLDIDGNLLWIKRIGGTSSDSGNEIMVDASNNVYVAGYFQGTVDFDPNGTVSNLTSAGAEDAFLLKLDSNGDFQWAKKIGGASSDKAFSLAEDNSGNIVVVGYIGLDLFIYKYNSSGTIIWQKTLTPNVTSNGLKVDVAIDGNDNVYMTGPFYGTMDTDPSASTSNIISAGSVDAFVLKLDVNGDFSGSFSLGSSAIDVGRCISVDNSNNVLVAGSYSSTVDFDNGPGDASSTSNGGMDIFILKLDASLNYLWHAAVAGTASYDSPLGIIANGSDDIYISGEFGETADFDPGAGTANLTALGTGGGVDAFVLKLNSAGNYNWAVRFGEVDVDDSGTAIDLNSSNDIYVTGIFMGTVDFDPGIGVYSKTSNNNSLDTYQLKFSECIAGSITPDVVSLADVNGVCSVTSLTAPTATNNCSVQYTGTHNATLPITTQGTTVVTWTYDDGNGNTSTQTQDVVIDDITAPIADAATLSDVTSECSVTSLTAPTATDNCAGSITGTHNATLPITTQGTTTVTWTYDDGNGNTSTQTQDVVIDDATAPVADVASLSNITSECPVTSLTMPTATDNCVGSVTETHNVTLPITASGTTVVTWTYDDGNGNTSTQTQNVIITPIDNGVTQVDAVTLSADATGYNYQWIDCNNGNQAINGATSQTFVATANGSYAVEIDNGTCTVTSNCTVINQVGIDDLVIELVEIYPNPTSGGITISSEMPFNKIELVNTLGQRLGVYNITETNKHSLSLPEENGVYLVKIYFDKSITIKRIVKR